MSWNLSLISGPFQVPLYGPPADDGQGGTFTPMTGYQPGVVFVLPISAVTPDLAPYGGPLPPGVPTLGGEDCQALTFPDETTAQGPLAAYWAPDDGIPA